MSTVIYLPNPIETVSYDKLKERGLLDPSFVSEVDAMPHPKCGPSHPGGPVPKCMGWSIDAFVTNAPVEKLNGVSARSAKALSKSKLKTIGDMLNTKSDFSSPNFSERVRDILRRVKAGVQSSRLSD